jgi:hypothetical protein
MLARKFLAVGATALVSAGLYAGAAHSAGPVKIDVSRDKVTCTSVYGAIAFSPALVLGGTPGVTAAKVSVKGTVADCTDLTNPNVKLLKSTFAGTLTAPNNNALSLLGLQNVTGALTIKWKADKSSPILQTSSVVTPNAICGGLASLPAPFNAAQHGEFHIGAQAHCGGGTGPAQASPSATGAFSNNSNDGGAGSVTDALTVQDVNALTGPATGSGLTGVNLALGTITVG